MSINTDNILTIFVYLNKRSIKCTTSTLQNLPPGWLRLLAQSMLGLGKHQNHQEEMSVRKVIAKCCDLSLAAS